MITTTWTNSFPMPLESMAGQQAAQLVYGRTPEETIDFCRCNGECNHEELAFTLSGGKYYQNDQASFIAQKVFTSDTITYKLVKGGVVVATLNSNTYGTYYDFGTLRGNSVAKGFLVDWLKVQQGLGYGKYIVRTEIVSLGTTYTYDSHTYNVVLWNPDRANNTVRIESFQSGFIMNGFNYGEMGWYQSIRIVGKFGFKTPELISNNYQDTNRRVQPIQDEIKYTYKLITHLLPSNIFNPIIEDKLLTNDIYITDYNIKNQEIYRRKPVTLTAIPQVENHNLITKSDFVFEFKDRIQDVIKRNLSANFITGTFMPVGQVANVNPLTVDFSVNDTSAETNQTLTFTSTITGGTPILYEWDFGDGTNSSDANPTHEYLTPGTYTITLFATDGTNSGYLVRTSYIVVALETPPQTDLQAWYKAGVGVSPSNMTLVSGKVSNWVDAINGYDIAQGTALKRPPYTNNSLNGYASVDFTAHQLTNSNGAFTRATGSTIITVFKLTALGGTDVLHEAAVSNLYEVYFANEDPTMYNGTFRPAYWGVSKDYIIMINCFDGANSYNRYNDQTKELVGNTGTSSSSGFTLGGATGSGGADVSANVCEVMIYSSEPSPTDLNLVTRYLRTKFAL